MENENKENLEEILSGLFDPQEAEAVAEDIRVGDEILESYGSPEPDEILISNIKADISVALSQRQTASRKWVFAKAVAIAAAFIILAAVSVRLFEKDSAGPAAGPGYVATVTSEAFWEDDETQSGITEFAVLVAEVELVEGELLALELGEEKFNGYEDSLEIENELVEINSDFWKG